MSEVKSIDVQLSEPQMDIFNARTSLIAEIAGQGAGKTATLGLLVGWKVLKFPEAKGFLGANTHVQLSDSTLTRVFHTLENVYGMTEYHKINNPTGHFVVGVKPPRSAGWKIPKYKFKTYHSVITFWNGATVFMGSLNKYKAHDGKEFAWAHLDETKDTKKEAVTDVIMGRLRQKGLYVDESGAITWNESLSQKKAKELNLKPWNPLYIHTSPAEGSVEWLIDTLGIAAYEKEIRDKVTGKDDYFFKKIVVEDKLTKLKTETTVVVYSSYWNYHNLPAGFIESRVARLSASEALKFVYGYPFGRNGGEYCPGFDRFKHVTKNTYDKELALHTAWDFNATPFVTLLISQVQYITRYWCPVEKKKYNEFKEGRQSMKVMQIRFLREYCMPSPTNTTEQTADAFADDYEQYNPDLFIYGDASGHSRIEGFGNLTNYKIIYNRWYSRFYLADGYMRALKVNMQNRKRRDMLNRIWEDRMPEVEVIIDESMTNTIRDLEYTLQGADGGKLKELETDKNGMKYQKLGHCLDALEYELAILCSEFMKE